MDRPSDSQTPSQPQPLKQTPPRLQTLYLILYNFLSATLWSAVLCRVLLIALLHGGSTFRVFLGVAEYVKWVQTLAGLEVAHSLSGLVRAPVLTTLMQVASRFLLVWGIAHNFPSVAASSPAYGTMLIAWSVTEVIRYGYFAVNLAYGGVPAWLTWLRYNTFFVLYPLGIGSECWLVYQSLGPAGRMLGPMGYWGLVGVLAVYVPGSYILFTHMMAQRRKVMRGTTSSAKKTK